MSDEWPFEQGADISSPSHIPKSAYMAVLKAGGMLQKSLGILGLLTAIAALCFNACGLRQQTRSTNASIAQLNIALSVELEKRADNSIRRAKIIEDLVKAFTQFTSRNQDWYYADTPDAYLFGLDNDVIAIKKMATDVREAREKMSDPISDQPLRRAEMILENLANITTLGKNGIIYYPNDLNELEKRQLFKQREAGNVTLISSKDHEWSLSVLREVEAVLKQLFEKRDHDVREFDKVNADSNFIPQQ